MRRVAIETEDVRYVYPDGTVGVEQASIKVYEGERVAILGPNGCGKSTLLKLIDGLLKPQRGTIKIFGELMNERSARKLRRIMGFVFQCPDDMLFCPTVREDLEFGPVQLGLSKEEIESRLKFVTELLKIQELLERPPFRLSEGEKKKVAIASVLMTSPKIMLVDEPTTYLDSQTSDDIVMFLNKLNKEGVTLLIATQEVYLVPLIADRVYLLGPDKRILAEGSVEEILLHPDLLKKAGISAFIIKLFLRLQKEGQLTLNL